MLDEVGVIETAAQRHPLEMAVAAHYAPVGSTVADIVDSHALDPRYGVPEVRLIHGMRTSLVPVEQWAKVRPKAGTRVEIRYIVEAAAAAALVTAGAQWIAGTALGLATTSFAYKAVVLGVTVLGSLAISALIPPPPQPSQSAVNPSFGITGVSNAETKYGIYPKVLGRHRMYPVKTATGFSETVDDDELYYYGRMTFGWGPLSLEDLRIGTTPIHQFSDVELEFLNVDEAATLAAYPEIADITRAWRTGTAALDLYPDDIAEDAFSDLLERDVALVRNTRTGAKAASIDLTWPQGIGALKPEGDIRTRHVGVEISYRPAGGSTWTLHDTIIKIAKTRDALRQTVLIEFPSEDEYEIRLIFKGVIAEENIPTLTFEGRGPDDQEFWDTYLTAIRTIRAGELPSHDGIAEVAFRIRASEQLNGQVDSLNAMVQQRASVWTGSAWSAEQAVRHPAWVFLSAVRGPHMAHPVADARIDLAAFKAWADEEPHWACDFVVDSETRLGEVLDVVAAAGRAKKALADLKYSIIRDGAAGPVRQVFTPRNSWAFQWSKTFGREIHGFRVQARSESLDYEFDEFNVYLDGYNAGNATEFETLTLRGVTITAGESDQGNAWRLARYHLAQYALRPEVFEFEADFEALRVTRGDKIRVVHDAFLIGIGQGRIRSIDTGTNVVTLDDDLGVSGSHKLTVRKQDGTLTTWTASGSGAAWTGTGYTGAQVGDLVIVEEVGQDSTDLLVTGIYPNADGGARLTCVPASPGVLTADSGSIPAYSPSVTQIAADGPPKPVIVASRSDDTTLARDRDGIAYPRISVELRAFAAKGQPGALLEVRWRENTAGARWIYGASRPLGAVSVVTDKLVEGLEYIVEVRSVNAAGVSRGWVASAATVASLAANPPGDVTAFAAVATSRSVLLTWEKEVEPDLKSFVIRLQDDLAPGWAGATTVVEVTANVRATSIPPQAGTYLIKATDYSGRESVDAASVAVSGADVAITSFDLASELQDIFGDLLGEGTDFSQLALIDVIRAAQSTISQATTVATAAADEVVVSVQADVAQTISDLGGLTTTVGQASGRIDDIENFTLSPTSALAQKITNIELEFDAGEAGSYAAGVQTALNAKVSAAGAVSAVTSEVSASFGSLTAFASAAQIAKATRDQLLSGYIWRVNGGSIELVSISDVDANGVAGAPVVTTKIDSDYVQITGIAQIDTAVIENLVAASAFIDNLYVETFNLAGNSVTIPAVNVGSVKAGNGSFQRLAIDTVSMPYGGHLLILWNIEHGYTGAQDWGFRIVLNATTLLSRTGMTFGNDYPAGAFLVEGVVPGNKVVELEWNGANSNITGKGTVILQAVMA